ncbi:MAG: phosphate/phosphite/phosphonate ABC transporter substrate-binding protein [bacterium]
MLISLVLFQWACGASQGEKPDSIDTIAVSLKVEQNKPIIYFGVISRYNPRIMIEDYQPIMDYLTENTPYHFELKLGKTYEDAVRYLCSGEVQIASLGAVTYLEAHKQCGAVPIVRPLNKEGNPYYRSITVVRNDSPLQSLADLRGRSFAFASLHSTSGNLIPRYYLAKAGIHLQDFSQYHNLRHHDSVAKAVLEGHYEAGALKDIIAYRYLKKGLRILHVSEPIPSVPIVVRPDCDPNLVAAAKKALLKIDAKDPVLQARMANWNEEFRYGFTEARDSDYAGLRQAINEIPRRCGSSCHPSIRF